MMRQDRGNGLFFLAALVLLLLLVGAYSNFFQNSPHFDDTDVVETNLYIRNIRNIPLFFQDASTGTSNPLNALYRPLVTTSLAIDYWIAGGLKLPVFHTSQLLMLLLLVALVFLLFDALLDAGGYWRWNRYLALFAAAVFGLHVTNTETMNLLHARSELLSTIGVVASFLIYIHFPRARRTYLYLLPMVVGALAKLPSIMFAPLLVTWCFLFEQQLSLSDLFSARKREQVWAAIRPCIPALVVAAVTFIAIGKMNAPTIEYGGGSRIDYLRTQFFAWLHYGRLFFVPVGLSADTDWNLIPYWYDTRVIAGLIFVAFLVRWIWTSSRSVEGRPIAFGLTWFCVALLPASSIFPLAEVTNEHRPFFAYVGLAIAIVAAIASLLRGLANREPGYRRAIVTSSVAISLAILMGLTIGTYRRNEIWRTEETLWRDVTQKSPGNGRGWMNYGLTQMSQGKMVEAKTLFDRALQETPNYSTLEINLGIVTSRLGDQVVAEQHFKRALALRPNVASSHLYYGRWLLQQGRSAEAIEHLQRAIALSPGELQARYELLNAYARAGRSADVTALAKATLALAPGDATATSYLNGKIPPQSGGAVSAPSKVGELLNASLNAYQSGDFQKCIRLAQQALELKPDSAEAYNNIAAGNAAMKNWEEAIRAAQQALKLKPDFQLARNNLAWAESEQKKVVAQKKTAGSK
jgi:tetratricopeptide (TPR) repeat protein